ncbi:hypothetical protein FA132_25735 [Pseudomonas aeruginosa]|uniref:hypothetical protein n=1 Tax=Pseudomonas aeruginosa TaxID=287 RepID=UPI001053D96E|nr:hypothetical protein [Pseudomonas aeruginosa]MCO3748725.1 hypothetical protein [Pseudomonas aeruginosa]
MIIHGYAITAEQEHAALARMTSTFQFADIERTLIDAGVPALLRVGFSNKHIAGRAADRLIQRERKGGGAYSWGSRSGILLWMANQRR